MPRTTAPRLVVLAATLLVVAACGAKKEPDTTCIDIELSSDELSCVNDSDCALVSTGQVCPGYVPTVGNNFASGTLCANAGANSVGVARVAAQLATVPTGTTNDDYCDIVQGVARCLGGQCGFCGPTTGFGAPYSIGPGCSDDAGVADDGG